MAGLDLARPSAGRMSTAAKSSLHRAQPPAVRPGGAEAYALELYEAMRESAAVRAGAGRPHRPAPETEPPRHPGAPFSPVGGDPNQYFVFTRRSDFDFFIETYARQVASTRLFRRLPARAQAGRRALPAHALHRATTSSRSSRRMLPDAPIFYTLHEFLPICHRDGQMLRTNGELCTHASPRRCNECFPDDPAAGLLPARALHQVAPRRTSTCSSRRASSCSSATSTGASRARRIRFEDYGRMRQSARVPRRPESRRPQPPRVLRPDQPLQGRRRAARGDADPGRARRRTSTWCTARTSSCSRSVQQRAFTELLGGQAGRQRHLRRHVRPRRPAPAHGRDRLGRRAVALVGELAARDPGGLHARAARDLQRHRRDGGEGRRTASTGCTSRSATPHTWRRRSSRGVSTPGLWDRLREGIPPVYAMERHVDSLTRALRRADRRACRAARSRAAQASSSRGMSGGCVDCCRGRGGTPVDGTLSAPRAAARSAGQPSPAVKARPSRSLRPPPEHDPRASGRRSARSRQARRLWTSFWTGSRALERSGHGRAG